MISKPSKTIRACLIIFFVVLNVFLGYIFFFTDMHDFVHAIKLGELRDYSAGWTDESGETVDIGDISAGGFRAGRVLSRTLPDVMSETDAVCLSTSNLVFSVYVDDQLIYSFDTIENLTGTGDGVSYHMIGLGTKDQGSTLRIEAHTAFTNGHGGRINEIQFGSEDQFRFYILRKGGMGVILSFLMIVFGIVIIIFFFGMSRKSPMIRPIWALGVADVLFGLWSVCDTGIPQLLTGCTYASRVMVYGILHLAGFPLVYFVNAITRNKRRLYVYLSFFTALFAFGWLILARVLFGTDMHTMVGVIYSSYALELVWLTAMLIDNEIYCRKKKISSNMRYFYIGALFFIAASSVDMIRYIVGEKGSIGRGSWFRFGLVLFFVFMAFQIFDWWSGEKTSLERDRFINRLLQYIMDVMEPDEKINKVLTYLCEELHADRAYIFEDMNDGTFDNTYEYCAEGVTPEIDNLKGIPYDGVIDVWYEEYKKGGHILIYDIEKYREVSENMYNVLKPQGINTLVTGPLILDGEYIGFFGVDNPPVENMREISEIIRLLTFFLSELIARRDNHRRLVEYSYHDALTGAGNRRAMREFERENLDTTRPYGFITCDINGLKSVNDNNGHDAGDKLIKTVASCLGEVFGPENIYRMGGDEFAVYSFDENLSEFEEKVARIRSMVEEEGGHVAIGYSYAHDGDPDYDSRKIEADNRMYDEKRKFYSAGNDRRRPRV
ncbi:MAG: sensor domain-containing diguanylate cyclase [Lachnospiraceae bacterium]|nr:sensor domain-containing diguanylate cyclase [Lachnospiraceae bacterium]